MKNDMLYRSGDKSVISVNFISSYSKYCLGDKEGDSYSHAALRCLETFCKQFERLLLEIGVESTVIALKRLFGEPQERFSVWDNPLGTNR